MTASKVDEDGAVAMISKFVGCEEDEAWRLLHFGSGDGLPAPRKLAMSIDLWKKETLES
jgi:hypothetical protein